jgi:hypothetical protein
MTAAQLIRFGGPRRNFVLLLFACLATFFGVIFAFKSDGVPQASHDQPVISAPIELASTRIAMAPGTAPTLMRSDSSIPRLPAAAPAPIDDSPLVEQVPPTAAEAHERGAEMIGADEADMRAAAIRNLDSIAPQALDALEQTLRYDAIARNRLLAVNGLRRMALGGANRERVASVLQVAMADSDANVATSARDAYQEIAR